MVSCRPAGLQVTYQAGATPRPVALVQLCYSQQPGGGYQVLLLHVARSDMTPALQQLLCSKVSLRRPPPGSTLSVGQRSCCKRTSAS